MSGKAFQIRLVGAGDPVVVCKLAETEEAVLAWARAHGYRFNSHALLRRFSVKPQAEFAERFLEGGVPKILSSHDPQDLGVIMSAREPNLWTVLHFDPARLLVPAFLFNESAEFVISPKPRAAETSAVFEL